MSLASDVGDALRDLRKSLGTIVFAVLVFALSGATLAALYGVGGHGGGWSGARIVGSLVLSTLATLGIHVARALSLGALGRSAEPPGVRLRQAARLAPRLITLSMVELVILLALVGGGYLATLPLLVDGLRSHVVYALLWAPVCLVIVVELAILRLAQVLTARAATPAEALVLACDVFFRRPLATVRVLFVAGITALPLVLVAGGAIVLRAPIAAGAAIGAGLCLHYAVLGRFVGRDPRLSTG